MSIRPLILKDGIITPPRSATDTSSLLSALGLNLVNNTSDTNKPISIAQQAALDLKANLVSPNLTGTPTTTTATAGTNTTQIANCAFVSTAISNLVASSPAALDTLNELAAALGNDANFSTTVTNSLANKVDLTTNQSIGGIKTFSGGLLLPSTSGSSIGTIWRNVDNLEYKDSSNATKIILNSGGNLSNLSNPQTALNNLVGTQTANRVLRSNGTNVTLSQVALDTDTIGILPISLGGTSSNTKNFVDLTTAQTVAGIKTFTNRVYVPDILMGSPYTNGGMDVGKAYVAAAGDWYEDFKIGTGGYIRYRCGEGTNYSYTRQFMIVTANNGNINVPSTTPSTSTTTGALTVGGGAGFVGSVSIGGFTSLGDNISLKVKYLSGVTAATQGGYISIAHGLTGNKILGFTVKVMYVNNGGMPDAHTNFPGYQTNTYHDDTYFYIYNLASNSASVLSKTIYLTVFYSP